MGRSNKHIPVAGRTSAEKLGMKTFAQNLHTARTERGLSQADLARLIWGTTVDTRGYTVARKRDRISSYEAGKAIPEGHHLKQLADALGMPVEELAPDIVAANVDRGDPEIAINMVPGGENIVHLQVNCLTDLQTAMEVGQMISKKRVAARA